MTWPETPGAATDRYGRYVDPAPPHWAVQRVASALADGGHVDVEGRTAREIARRTGLKRRLVVQCLHHLRARSER